MNKQQEPRLRFKGFTGAWKEKYLNEIGEFSAGGDIKKEKLTPFGRYPVLANALTNNGIVGFYDDYEFESPAITITGRGDVGIAKARKENFSAVVRLLVLKNKPNYDVDFLEQAINKIDFHIESTGVPQLTVPQCKLYSIFLSSEPEQTHLGLFFSRLDSQIAESRAVLEKSRQLKKAMLAKMFPANGEKIPKIRFKGFEGEWREWKLGAFGKATSGTSLESEFCEDGNYKVISIGSYSEKSTYTDQGIRTHKNDKTEKRILNKNDLTMILNDKTSSGRIIGRVLLIDQNDTYVYNQRTQRIEIDQEHFIPLFLYHLLNADNMRQKIIYSAQGNTQIYVNWSGIKILEYLIPPTKAEQAAIGNFFRQLDETIASQSAEVEKLNQLKKGLLVAMLM